MSSSRRGRSLAVRIYLYSLFCVVSAVALFVLVAIWLKPSPPPKHMHHERVENVSSQTAAAEVRQPSKKETRGPGVPSELFIFTGAGMLVLVLVTSVLYARSLVRPLRQLASAATAFGEGDNSARARLNRTDEIGEVGASFDKMAEQTVRLIRSQRQLVANVAHELRTPLARIHVAMELAQEGDDATAREILYEIETDLSDLENLIDDVLTSARLEASIALARNEPFSVTEVLEQAKKRFVSLAEKHVLELKMPDSLPLLRGDGPLLRRAVDNLLDNACKYSDPGEPIIATAREESGVVIITIVDRGIGIDASDVEHVFSPFYRGDKSRSRGTGGVGLGLALAKQIVEAHAGTIDLESAVGEGTCVAITIPCDQGV